MENDLSQILGEPRIDIAEVFRENIHKTLIGSYLIDNLCKKEVQKLVKAKEDLTSIIITDLLANLKKNKLNIKDPESLDIYLNSIKKNTTLGNSFKFRSPEKSIAFLAYMSNIKNKESKEVLKKAKTKEDLKKIYYFDYLFGTLPKKRKSFINCDKSLDEVFFDLSKNYHAMNQSKKLSLLNEKLEQINTKIKKNLSKNNISEFILLKNKYTNENDSQDLTDPELFNLFKTYRSHIENMDLFILNKSKEKFDNEYAGFNKNYERLSKLKILDKRDEENLKKSFIDTKGLLEFLSFKKNLYFIKTQDLLMKFDGIINNYEEFKRYKNKFDSYLERLDTQTPKIEKLKVTSFFFNIPKKKSIEKIIGLNDEAMQTNNFVKDYKKNYYFSNYLSAYSEKLDKLSSLTNRIDKKLQGCSKK
jgi:hypothetical protein